MGDTSGGSGPQTGNNRTEFTYSYRSKGPFIVIVEGKNGNIGNYHPTALGKKFTEQKIRDIYRIKNKGKNRSGVEFLNAKAANEFLKHDIVIKEELNAYIPASLASCKGIARGIGLEVTVEEFINKADTAIPILEARRMTKQIDGSKEKMETEDIIVTFHGTTLPRNVKIFYYESKIDLYIPRPLQCKKCLRYGHHEKQCRGKLRCAKCAEEHETDSCTVEPKCVFCNGPHLSTERKCEEFKRQKLIKKTMAIENISYFEARKKYPTRNTEENSQVKYTSQFSEHPQDFPKLPQKESEFIKISQRATTIPAEKVDQTFSRVVQRKRRSITPLTPEMEHFDQNEHNNCLFPSPCRTSISKLDFVEPIPIITMITSLIEKINMSREGKEHIINEIQRILGEKPIGKNEQDAKENQKWYEEVEMDCEKGVEKPLEYYDI